MAKADINLIGFETGNSLELDATSGTVSIQNTTARTGYALRCNPTSGGAGFVTMSALAGDGRPTNIGRTAETHYQWYFRVGTMPSSTTDFGAVSNAAGTPVVRFFIKSTGAVYIDDALGNLSGDSSVLSINTWYRLCLTVTSNATSTLAIYENASPHAQVGATISVTAANNTQDKLAFGTGVAGGNVDFYFDDVTIGTSGPVGPGTIVVLRPNANGTYGAWGTGGTGNTFAEVDDIVHDGDTTYIGATATGDNTGKTFNMTACVDSGYTYGSSCAIKATAVCRTDSTTGTSVVSVRVRSGTTDVDTTPVEWTTTYLAYSMLRTTDPNGGGVLSRSVLDAIQVGVFAGALAQPQRCTQILLNAWAPEPYVVPAAQGSYTLTGQAASLKIGRKIEASYKTGAFDIPTFAFSAVASTFLTYARKMPAAQGGYTLSGQESILRPLLAARDAQASASSNGATSGTSLSWSHTCTGSNRVLLVWVAVLENSFDNSITGVTYNGVAMTQLDGGMSTEENTGARGALFGLVGPATGSHTVTVNFADNTWWAEGVSASFINVHQLDPWDDISFVGGVSSGSGQDQTATVVTDQIHDLVVDFFSARADSLISEDTSNQTAHFNSSASHIEGSTGYSTRNAFTDGASSYDMTWTAVSIGLHHVHAAVALRGASILSNLSLTASHGGFTYTGQSVLFDIDRKIVAEQGSYSLIGQAVNLLRGFEVLATQGSYALAGQDVTLTYTPIVGYTLTASHGTYVLSGQAVNLLKGYAIAAAQGSYSLTGQAAAFRRTHIMQAAYAVYSLAGQVARLLKGFKVQAAFGDYDLNGQAAGLRRSRIMPSNQGAYTLSGQLALLERGLLVTAGQGTYTLTGQNAGMRRSLEVNANQGSYTLSGQTVLFDISRVLVAGSGDYDLNGQDVGLSYSGSLKEVQADTGLYDLAGQDASLNHGRFLLGGSGSYSLSGQPATLETDRRLASDQGSYSLSGQSASFLHAIRMLAAQGSYTWSGQNAGMLRGLELSAGSGDYDLNGQDASLDYEATLPVLNAESGSYALAGQDANLVRSLKTQAEYGSFSINGQNVLFFRFLSLTAGYGPFVLGGQVAGLLRTRIMGSSHGSYVLTGENAGLLYGKFLIAQHGSYVLSGQVALFQKLSKLLASYGSYAVLGQDAFLGSSLWITITGPKSSSNESILTDSDRSELYINKPTIMSTSDNSGLGSSFRSILSAQVEQ